MAVPEASERWWHGHRAPACEKSGTLYPRSSVVIVGSSESGHTVPKATPFLNIGILKETGPPRQDALAHSSSNEFTVWVLAFVVFNVTDTSV